MIPAAPARLKAVRLSRMARSWSIQPFWAAAMPETGIGLFPDVGGGWYLPRLPGKAGLWLALTGARIKGADCLRLGIATHFVEFGAVEGLKKAIIADPRRIEETLKKYRADAGKAPLVSFEQDLNRLFVGDSVEQIFEFLEADSSDWGKAQLAVMKTKSPQTLKVAFRQLEADSARSPAPSRPREPS